MAKPNFDGVIQAVRYRTDGQIDWVRAYLRRGPTFSDYVLLSRQDLIAAIKSGKRFVTGDRIPLLASTFKVCHPVQIVAKDGREILLAGEAQTDKDYLEGVPLI